MGVIGGYISTSIWVTGMAIYEGNRRPYIHVNLGQFGPRVWPYIGVTGGYISKLILAMGMTIYRGNRRLDLVHAHDYIEVIKEYISLYINKLLIL